MSRDLNKWSRKDFLAVPHRKGFHDDIGEFDSLVIIPERYKHDSGYSCMSFVAFIGDTPIARLGGCSDVINLDGMGAQGNWLSQLKTWDGVRGVWSIDCLHKSKLLRLFHHRDTAKMTCGADLSNFEVFALPKKELGE